MNPGDIDQGIADLEMLRDLGANNRDRLVSVPGEVLERLCNIALKVATVAKRERCPVCNGTGGIESECGAYGQLVIVCPRCNL